MAKKPKEERDRNQKGSIAEEFHLTKEAKFRSPTLEEEYWDNPNSQRGSIARCRQPEWDVYQEDKYSEGV